MRAVVVNEKHDGGMGEEELGWIWALNGVVDMDFSLPIPTMARMNESLVESLILATCP